MTEIWGILSESNCEIAQEGKENICVHVCSKMCEERENKKGERLYKTEGIKKTLGIHNI